MFVRTTAINKILQMKARKKVIQGGSSAGKTFGVLPILIDKCCKEPNLEVSVVAESVPHLKKGALKDFIKIMKATNRWRESNYNATDRKYTFGNGSYIEFFSPESIIGSRRNILYINEAPFIKYEDYYQMAIRTSGEIFMDFNPFNEFWVHTEVLKESDSELLILTYRDNEALPVNVLQDFEQAKLKSDAELKSGKAGYWTNFVNVYVDGKIGTLQGAIFNNWNQINEVPKDADLIAYGLDWGFTNDATGLIAVYKWNGKLIVKELLYETRLTNSMLVDKMKALNIPLDADIVADSSEPKSIQDLINMGYSETKGASKGQDSVRISINKLQEFEILVTSDSLNLIKELRGYVWLDSQKPIDKNNHCIDPLRYVALNCLMSNNYFEMG